MKKIFIVLIFLALSICFSNAIFAQETIKVDMKDWTFVMLTNESDQDENVIVCKFYNAKDKDKYAFCIEPNQSFLPSKDDYFLTLNDNDFIYKIVKSYDEIGKKNNNYYIATQILIWKEVSGIDYTFKGNDYETYKNELLDNAFPKSKKLQKTDTNDVNNYYESYLNEENEIKYDYSDYVAEGEGIKITQNSSDGFKYIILDEEPLIKTINFTPLNKDEENAFVYSSEESQDLYVFDGEYNKLQPFKLNLITLKHDEVFDIYYSKKDLDGNIIEGAEFSVFAVDTSEADELLYFIKKDRKINLFDFLLNGINEYSNLSIKISERYEKYINGAYIEAQEIGYFPFEVYEGDNLLKKGTIFVTDNSSICDESSKISVKSIYKGYSGVLDKNSINGLSKNSSYYLCETEPKKGYEYASEPCIYVDPNEYLGETLNFINNTRTYTLRLMKESPEEIFLNGAEFKITYKENGIDKTLNFTTGSLIIDKKDSNKYLIYKHENEDKIYITEFNNDTFILNNAKPGKYYYYQTNDCLIKNELLNDEYVFVVDGGYVINNLPYSSKLIIEELKAPEGFIITEPKYELYPDIKYSEITFKNYRVNYFDIIPERKFKIPKTCIKI